MRLMGDLNLDGLTETQLRLFAVRCARRVQHLMTDPCSLAALDVAERHAKGEATNKELAVGEVLARNVASHASSSAAADAAAWAAASAASAVPRVAAEAAASATADAMVPAAVKKARAAEKAAQEKILKQIRKVPVSDLYKMWTLFEQYQSFADAKGHGESWKRMTTERTRESMRVARAAAAFAGGAWNATAAAKNAAWAAHAAVYVVLAAAKATEYAAAARFEARAIEYITQAIKEAQA